MSTISTNYENDRSSAFTETENTKYKNESLINSEQQITSKPDVYIKTFGGFGVYVNGRSLHFPRKRSAEILAVLLDHHGAVLTNSMIISILWKDECTSPKVKMQYMKAFQVLKRTLADAGISHILIDDHNSKGINTSMIRCDYFDAMNDTYYLIRKYHCDYLPDYSWAEATNGYLYQLYLTAIAKDKMQDF